MKLKKIITVTLVITLAVLALAVGAMALSVRKSNLEGHIWKQTGPEAGIGYDLLIVDDSNYDYPVIKKEGNTAAIAILQFGNRLVLYYPEYDVISSYKIIIDLKGTKQKHCGHP